MKLTEAKHIVDVVSNAYAGGPTITKSDRQANLVSELKGYSVFEIDIAFKLWLAAFLQNSPHPEQAKEVIGQSEAMVSSLDYHFLRDTEVAEFDRSHQNINDPKYSLDFIHLRGWLARDGGPTYAKWKSRETMRSFANRCYEIGIAEPLYWQTILTHMGISSDEFEVTPAKAHGSADLRNKSSGYEKVHGVPKDGQNVLILFGLGVCLLMAISATGLFSPKRVKSTSSQKLSQFQAQTNRTIELSRSGHRLQQTRIAQTVGGHDLKLAIGPVASPIDKGKLLLALFGNYNDEDRTSYWNSISLPKTLKGKLGEDLRTEGKVSVLSVLEMPPLLRKQPGIWVAITETTIADFDCHVCSALIGVALLSRDNFSWVLEDYYPYVEFFGSSGFVDGKSELVPLGPRRFGVLLRDTYSSQGESGEASIILTVLNGQFKRVWEGVTKGDNSSAVGEERPEDAFSFDTQITFKENAKHDWYDIMTNKKGSEWTEAGVVPVNESIVYRFDGERYRSQKVGYQ